MNYNGTSSGGMDELRPNILDKREQGGARLRAAKVRPFCEMEHDDWTHPLGLNVKVKQKETKVKVK